MADMLFKAHLFIPEERFAPQLKKMLTFDNPLYARQVDMDVKTNVPPTFVLYKYFEVEGKGYYRVPRYTLGNPSEVFANTNAVRFDVQRVPAAVQWKPPSKFDLNPQQEDTIQRTIDMLTNEWGAVIVASPGEGKTTMAIRLIATLEQKTLILVHKNSLIEQWRKQLLMLTTLKESDIGLLQQGKFVDGLVVIGSQASLMRATIPNDVVNKKFGLVIQDEIHRIGAEMFLRSFTRFNSQFRLGLSATPVREDGMEQVYFLHSSNNLIQHRSVRNVAAAYRRIDYERVQSWSLFPSWIPLKTRLINNIVKDEARNDILMQQLTEAVVLGRHVLVLSERVKHLKELMLRARVAHPGMKIVRFFGPESLTKKQRAEGSKAEKIVDPTQDELRSADIIFATYSKAKEGVDIPHLDTLLFATPFSSRTTLVQAKGRIERTYADKQSPLVIDIVDSGQFLLEAMSNKRRRIYEELHMRKE